MSSPEVCSASWRAHGLAKADQTYLVVEREVPERRTRERWSATGRSSGGATQPAAVRARRHRLAKEVRASAACAAARRSERRRRTWRVRAIHSRRLHLAPCLARTHARRLLRVRRRRATTAGWHRDAQPARVRLHERRASRPMAVLMRRAVCGRVVRVLVRVLVWMMWCAHTASSVVVVEQDLEAHRRVERRRCALSRRQHR